MRALLFYPTLLCWTLLLGCPVLFVTLLGIPIKPGSRLSRTPGIWCRMMLRSAGVKLVIHPAKTSPGEHAAVYVSNHVSWFDVFALGSLLPRARFMAKKELASLPVFGSAIKQVAAIFIDRQNRRAAFDSYAEAAAEIGAGTSVVVYPEGTRGRSYALRPFKKGPFVLAIAAQAPIVPVLMHGTREVQGKGEMAVHGGTCELTFLDPIPTAGMTYEDRERLKQLVWERMAAELERRYGIQSHTNTIDTPTTAA
ncbi:MAG TPA: lysophospholipid acyltransferase family protein [Gemmatimonadaceae bacterium]|nr:lysophospholipid acyltransferase family protein [Gemmatimonadaceae bacterium]